MNPTVYSAMRAAKAERDKGNTSRSNGVVLIALGVLTLPFPIIGLPLLLTGLVKAFTAKDGE